MSSRIKSSATNTTNRDGVISKAWNLAVGTGHRIEKAIVGGSTILGLYNANNISHKITDLCNIDDLCQENPYTAIVLGSISSAILANLLGRGIVEGSRKGYNYLIEKRNVISRPGTTNTINRNGVTSVISGDTLIEREIIDTKIRNLEDVRDTITEIINKVKTIESDLKYTENKIDTHINKNTPDDKNEVISHYAGTDGGADIIDINSLVEHNQYFTTKFLSEKLLDMKKKKEITDKYLPRIQYNYDANNHTFISSGKYLIGSIEIGGRLDTLDILQQQLKTQINSLSDIGRSSNASLHTLNGLQNKLNYGDLPQLCQLIIEHVKSLGLSNIKDKKRPIEETLMIETQGLEDSIKNSQSKAKNIRDKITKK